MPSETESQSPPTPRSGGRGLEVILFLVAFACLGVFGYQAYRHYNFKPTKAAPTGKIMADLQETDHIPLSPGDAKGYNLIIITMDTTRADHLECYGNRAVRTPNLNDMARHGVLFANAFTPSPSTLPGHSSIMTGLYPYHHGARANGTFKLGPSQTTLAEILKQHGYATGAAISAYVLDSRFGISQGFDDFNDDLSKGVKWAPHMFRERPAEYTNEVVFKWLDEHVSQGSENDSFPPFFFWVHYFDDHAPYMPAEPFRTQYAGHLYDGEIAYVDANIGKLLTKLKDLGIRDKTLIVVAGDHGEGLGEHGEQTHSLLTYDATLHTPLIFNSPTLLPTGRVVRRTVSNVDIVPTVLDLLGVNVGKKFDGVSLAADPKTWPQGIYFETIATLTLHGWAPLFGIRHNDVKYIHAPTPEIYDIKNDPKELNNLFNKRPEQAVALSMELEEHVSKDPFFGKSHVQIAAMAPDVAKKLAALGYVGSKSGGSIDVAAAAEFDPKDMVPHWEKITKANNQIASGKFSKGVAMLEECVQEVPKDVWALRSLSTAYMSMGKVDEAEQTMQKALKLEKHDSGIYLSLARLYIRKKKFDEAEKAINQADTIDPNLAGVVATRAALAAAENQIKKAEKLYQEAIKLDPGTTGPGSYVEMGGIYLQALQLDKAREAFENAIKLDSLNAGAHAGLANVFIEEGKLDEAQKELQIALRFNPNQPLVLASLASLYDKKHEFERAKTLAERALDINAHFFPALNNLGLILKHTGHLDKAMELFNKALELQPRYLACRINLALSYMAKNEEEKGVEEFRKILKYNRNVPIALANVGTYHANHGRPGLAMRFFARALRLNPKYALVHAHMGHVLMHEGRIPQALVHLKKSLELEPDQPRHEELRYQIEQLQRITPKQNKAAGTTQPAAAP